MPLEAAGGAERRALLLVWTDIADDVAGEFNDWYNHEHLRERVAVCGFIRGRRYCAITGAPRYLALYEVRDAAVFQTDAYLQLKRRRDARSLQFVPLFKNTIKATCDVIAHAGAGGGEFLFLLPLCATANVSTACARDMSALCRGLTQIEGVTAATITVANAAARADSAPFDVRQGDRHLESVIMVEAMEERGAARAAEYLHAVRLAGIGMAAAANAAPALLRSIFSMHHSQE